MASFSQSLIDNPITEAELNHQQRSTAHQKWELWSKIFAVGLGLALLSTASLLIAPQLAALLSVPGADLNDLLRGLFGTVTILMAGLIMVHQLSFSTAAVRLSSSSIAREKQGRTWESILLTGVDARRIILGKWWATMRTLWQAYRPVLVLRFAVTVWIGASSGLALVTRFSYAPLLLNILLIGVITAIFPLCYAAFMVSLGLLASLMTGSETAAYRVASFFQFALIVLSISMIILSFALPFIEIDAGLVTFIPALFVTPFDGGMLALVDMLSNNGSTSLAHILGLLLCVAFYGLLTWLTLRGVQMLTVRQRAMPPI